MIPFASVTMANKLYKIFFITLNFLAGRRIRKAVPNDIEPHGRAKHPQDPTSYDLQKNMCIMACARSSSKKGGQIGCVG